MGCTIQNALIPTSSGYETVNIRIEGDRIAAIAPHLEVADSQGETCIDGQNKLLLPGFVNAHTHSSELWQRGLIPPYPLELWLQALHSFPLTPDQIYLAAVGTAIETLLSGGTSVVDHLVLIPGQEQETIAAAVRAYRDVGIRAFVGPLIQDQSLSAGLPSGGESLTHVPYSLTTADILALMEETVAQFHRPDEGINILVAPTGMQLCSDALFQGCIDLSDRHQLCRHAHLLETKAQQLLAQEKYGCSAVEHLKNLGFLSSRTSLAHCVWLDDADIDILAATQSTVVHNPLSNLRLGSGIAPILNYLRAGVNVAYGCDGSASNDSQDLLEAVKIGTILHNITDSDYRHWITPRQSVQIAALGGATGLNLADQMGSLTVGKKADLVLYDLTNLSLLPRTDPIGLLVLGRPSQAVHSVWVNGRQLVSAGQPITVDCDRLRQDLFQHSHWYDAYQSEAIAELEGQYRAVMGLSSQG